MIERIGRSPKNVADILASIYGEQFGGKNEGRFRTSRLGFKKLARLQILSESYVREVFDWLLLHDLILINLDKAFCVIPANIAKSFRRVPSTITRKYSPEDETLTIDDDEDDED